MAGFEINENSAYWREIQNRKMNEQEDFYSKWHLSTEGYYFKYRADKYDSKAIRATLFRTKDNSRVDDVRVSEGQYTRKYFKRRSQK